MYQISDPLLSSNRKCTKAYSIYLIIFSMSTKSFAILINNSWFLLPYSHYQLACSTRSNNSTIERRISNSCKHYYAKVGTHSITFGICHMGCKSMIHDHVLCFIGHVVCFFDHAARFFKILENFNIILKGQKWLKLPSLFTGSLFETFHNKSHNLKALVILSHSWSPFLLLIFLYGNNELLWVSVWPSGVFSWEKNSF